MGSSTHMNKPNKWQSPQRENGAGLVKNRAVKGRVPATQTSLAHRYLGPSGFQGNQLDNSWPV